MLRSAATNLLRQADQNLGHSSFNLQFVRYRRKPRWLPVAKSKMFRIPEHPEQSDEEKAELLRLHNHYRTQMRSVRLFLREEAQRIRQTSSADHLVMTPEEEEAEFQKCVAINDEWNKKISEERNQRLEADLQKTKEFVDERLEAFRERKEEHIENIDAIVKAEKEMAKTFITREKLDEAIETALANPIDYNFSIDLKRNMYHGRLTRPEKEQRQLEAAN
ncbi:mRpS26 family protein [Megaselia abdita]